MDKWNLNHSAPNLAVVCIDTKQEEGRLYHRYIKEPIVFHQFAELLLELDVLYDRLNFPQASLEIRHFTRNHEGTPNREQVKPQVSSHVLTEHRGDLATFLVHVKRRQKATWQGEILWVERAQNDYFESELDLLKILDLTCC